MAINKLTPKLSLDGIWRGAYGEDCGSPARFADVADLSEIEAAVPGTMESDMEKAGVLPEIYRGENVLLTQDVENYHYCLSRTSTMNREKPTMFWSSRDWTASRTFS